MTSSKFYIYRRPNGYWYIGYWLEGRRLWRSTDAKSKTEAFKVLRDFEEHQKQDCAAVSFGEFVTQFCLLQKNDLRESTVQRIYIPAFNSFQRICGNKLLTSYSIKDVEAFKRVMLEEGHTPVTVNIQFRTLRASFNVAMKWQLIANSPFAASHSLKVPDQMPIHLTRSEFQSLIEAVKEKELKEVFFFAALTGLRLGEILSLTWEKIDFAKEQILVANSKDFLTKTGKWRSVPMNRLVHELLSHKQGDAGVSQFVFHRNRQRLLPSYVSHRFKSYSRLVGLSEKIHFHSLRHTFATWLVQGGVNIYEVQKLLGHSSVKVTEVYSHLAASELHEAVNTIVLE